MCRPVHRTFYDPRPRRVRDLPCGDKHVALASSLRRVRCARCGSAKDERPDGLADNPFSTRRFAFFVGRRGRATTAQDVAGELLLDGPAVQERDKPYMAEQGRRVGCPAPRVIGIDESAPARGHAYRIVVSDLERGRPIGFGGHDRSAARPDQFFARSGPKKCRRIRRAVMDRGPAFRPSTRKNGKAPPAESLYAKFHTLMPLGAAMD